MTVVYACRVKADQEALSPSQRRTLHSRYARALLAYAAQKAFGLDVTLYREDCLEAGKPYLVGAPFHFNLSHSGDWAVCALSDACVGVDIERLRPIDGRVQRRMLGKTFSTPWEQVSAWTRYESYGKMIGCGIPYSLGNERPSFYRTYAAIEGYLVTACSSLDAFSDDLILCDVSLS